ncbi:MAG: phage tail protein [Candidatus Methanomethylophilus sp.]|nr:phage tail protein [Methanomethylophilus sp.]
MSVDTSIDSAPTLTISLPQNDEKAVYISPLYYAKIYNTQTAAYEFSVFELVDPEIVDSGSGLSITATYQGVLTRLSSEIVETYDTGSAGKSLTTIVGELLALQVNTPAVTLGTIEPSQTVAITAENGTIYGVLNSIRDAYGGWFEVDASRALNWYEDNTGTPEREIRREKNLKAITVTPGYSRVVNRVYAYGKGESDARLELGDILIFQYELGGMLNGGTEIQKGETLSIGTPAVHCVVIDITTTFGTWASGLAKGVITAVPPDGGWDGIWPLSGSFFDASTAGARAAIATAIFKAQNVDYIEDTASQATYGIRAKKYIDKSITHPVTLLAYAQRILAEYKDPPYQYTVDVVNLADVGGYSYALESLGLDTRVRVIDELLSVDVDTSIVSMSINLLAPENITIELSTIKNDLSDLFGKILNVQDIASSVATQIGAGQVTVLGTFTVIDWASDGVTTIDGGNITANTITTSQLNFTPVDSTNVIGSINASAEGIVISGDKISITAGRGNRTFRQDDAPVTPPEDIRDGDLWFDTDDNNVCYSWSGSAWVDTRDAGIAQAISDAAGAQSTADGKVTTFYQNDAPTAEGTGDLWVDTNDGNKLYRWSGSAWVEVQDAGIAQAIGDAATAQSTADGKIVTFYQTTAPTAEGEGDLWFDTDDNNKCYRWSGSAWVETKLANTGNIISTINVSTEGVAITGDRIAISGSTTFSSGYDPTTKVASLAGVYNSAASGARVRIFPDANTGIQVVNASAADVFKCLVGGTDTGDVIIGDYAGGKGVKWDDSASTFDIKGNLSACTISSGQTMAVYGNVYFKDNSSSTEYFEVDNQFIGVYFNSSLVAHLGCDLNALSPIRVTLPSSATGTNTPGLYVDSYVSYRSAAHFQLLNSSASTPAVYINTFSTTQPALQVVGLTSCQKISCSNISCYDVILTGGLHFNGNTSHDVIYSNGSQLIYRDSSGNSHTIQMV